MNVQKIGLTNFIQRSGYNKSQNNITEPAFGAKKMRLSQEEISRLLDIEAELKPERIQSVQTFIKNLEDEAETLLERFKQNKTQGLSLRIHQHERTDNMQILIENSTANIEFDFKTLDYDNRIYEFQTYRERKPYPSITLVKMFGINHNGTKSYYELSKDSDGKEVHISFDFDAKGKLYSVRKSKFIERLGKTLGQVVDLSGTEPKFESYSI